MAIPYVTGPVDIWVAPGNEGAIFLGHAEHGPTISVRPRYSPVYVDLAGQTIPYDMVYDGEDAIVTATLTRWNQNVLDLIEAIANDTASGIDDPGDIGSLMLTEGKAYELWLHFPYAAKPAFADMLPGQRFPCAFLETDDSPALGTQAKKAHVVWHCLRYLDMSVTNEFGTGRFLLWDGNMSALGSID